MNHCIAKIGAVIVTAAVALFAIFCHFVTSAAILFAFFLRLATF